MSFKVGDKVDVLDEDLSGVIIKIIKDEALIETNDGFELEFHLKDLIKVESSADLSSNLFNKSSLSEVLNDMSTPKRKSVGTKKKERFQPTMEVDLHIDKLLNSTRDMSKHDILTYQLESAKRRLEFAIQKRIQKVVFIHGVGDGILKIELEYLFRKFDNIRFYDADYQKYGLGATEVYITQKAM